MKFTQCILLFVAFSGINLPSALADEKEDVKITKATATATAVRPKGGIQLDVSR